MTKHLTQQDTLEAAAKLADERTAQIIQDYFNEGEKRKRFIDTNRIPFICDDIKAIHVTNDQMSDDIKLIKQTLDLIQKIVFGFIGIVLVAMVYTWLISIGLKIK